MTWYSDNRRREKIAELVSCSTQEIAETILEMEDEKVALEEQVAELTKERDELAARVEA